MIYNLEKCSESVHFSANHSHKYHPNSHKCVSSEGRSEIGVRTHISGAANQENVAPLVHTAIQVSKIAFLNMQKKSELLSNSRERCSRNSISLLNFKLSAVNGF